MNKVDLEKIFELLAPLCRNDPTSMREWFYEPNVYWMGLSPVDLLAMGKGDAVVRHLEWMHNGEVSGS